MSSPLTPVIERVRRHVRVEDRGHSTPCLIYEGALGGNGYGQTYIGSRLDGTRRNQFVHRVVWEHFNGAIPDGMQIDHLCRQKTCCKLSHLEVVTPAENWMRTTGPATTRARAAAVTHCPLGHEYTPENTRWKDTRGYQTHSCRTCERFRGQLWRIRLRLGGIA